MLQSFDGEWSYFTPYHRHCDPHESCTNQEQFHFLRYMVQRLFMGIYRYIDDIFFIWTSDEESLTRFIDHTNSFHSTIKFTSEYTTTETHFHDVVIRKEENGLTTDLFVKPTDKHQYIHSASCHPRHCKTSRAYSQALRLRRICSNDSDFLRHSQVLKKHLVSRGHSSRAVHQAIQKVKSMPRLSVLSEKPTTRDCANEKIPIVVTYHSSLPPIRQITSANHHILHTSDRLQRAIPEEPPCPS